ncbi:hypothetical protein [Halostella pelagica]|uniref:hypothetical protein n=1 Tax=Halostella pelagica TaxID=2583824 RepID=UPI001080FEAB|nr:hypothetical protein [Halostella pelagica]
MSDSAERPFEERLEDKLMGVGAYLADFAETSDGVEIEYETVSPGDGVPHRQVGQVLQTLWDVRGEDADPVTVRATVTDDEGNRRGRWRAEAEWVAALGDDMTQTEFSQRVLDTIEEP